jgi:ABC-type microcin C transport system permease subunit YejB
MVAYIIRRLLLVIPTLLGVMIVNFALIQFVPGGPVEQVLAQLEGEGDVFAAITGGDDAGIGETRAMINMLARAVCLRSILNNWSVNSASIAPL